MEELGTVTSPFEWNGSSLQTGVQFVARSSLEAAAKSRKPTTAGKTLPKTTFGEITVVLPLVVFITHLRCGC